MRHAAVFHNRHAEEFVSYLRRLNVSPNGHANTIKRPLMDQGLQFVLECCRAMFNYAAKRRHLAPYAENPFWIQEIDRIPVEQIRPIVLMTPELERAFLESCLVALRWLAPKPDEWPSAFHVHVVEPERADLRDAEATAGREPDIDQVALGVPRLLYLHPSIGEHRR